MLIMAYIAPNIIIEFRGIKVYSNVYRSVEKESSSDDEIIQIGASQFHDSASITFTVTVAATRKSLKIQKCFNDHFLLVGMQIIWEQHLKSCPSNHHSTCHTCNQATS